MGKLREKNKIKIMLMWPNRDMSFLNTVSSLSNLPRAGQMQTPSQHSPHPSSESAPKITLVAEWWQEAREGRKVKAFLRQPVPPLHWHLPGASEPSSQTERSSLPLGYRRSRLSAPRHHFPRTHSYFCCFICPTSTSCIMWLCSSFH